MSEQVTVTKRRSVRRMARMLANNLCCELSKNDANSKLEAAEDGWLQLTAHGGTVAMKLKRRRLRIFDALHVTVDDADVWMPLAGRLRVRRALRRYLLSRATDVV